MGHKRPGLNRAPSVANHTLRDTDTGAGRGIHLVSELVYNVHTLPKIHIHDQVTRTETGSEFSQYVAIDARRLLRQGYLPATNCGQANAIPLVAGFFHDKNICHYPKL